MVRETENLDRNVQPMSEHGSKYMSRILWNISLEYIWAFKAQYMQDIHCLYLGIEGSEQSALLCSMTRVFTVYIWALKTQYEQDIHYIWALKAQYEQDIHYIWALKAQYEQDIHCLYLGIEDSVWAGHSLSISGHWRLSISKTFTVYIWALKAQYEQDIHCLYQGIEDSVWAGHSLSISRHWRLSMSRTFTISGHWRLSMSSTFTVYIWALKTQYEQDIHCLYLGIEGSVWAGHSLSISGHWRLSMSRTFTVYIWALKTQNSQCFCAVWSGHSLSISGHWRLRTTNASVQYDILLSISGHWRLRTASTSVKYDQGIRYLYLGIENSEQPALLCSMTRTFTVYIWALKAQNSQRFCAVWTGIHCLYLGIECSEQPALLRNTIRGFSVYIWALNSQRFCVLWPGHSLSTSGHWRLRTVWSGIHCLYLGIENSEQPAHLCSMTRTFTVYIWALKAQNSHRFFTLW